MWCGFEMQRSVTVSGLVHVVATDPVAGDVDPRADVRVTAVPKSWEQNLVGVPQLREGTPAPLLVCTTDGALPAENLAIRSLRHPRPLRLRLPPSARLPRLISQPPG